MWRPCSGWSAATCCSTPMQAVADEDAAAAFALAGARRRDGLRPARRLPRAVARRARPAGAVGRSVARQRPGDRRRRRARAADGAGRSGSRARTCCARSTCSTRAEADIRGAAQPRYHLEMALLRWIHLRKLVPIEDLIAGDRERRARRSAVPRPAPPAPKPAPAGKRSRRCAERGRLERRRQPPVAPAVAVASGVSRTRRPTAASRTRSSRRSARAKVVLLQHGRRAGAEDRGRRRPRRRSRSRRRQRALRDQFEQNRAWLESLAQQVAGRKIAVAAVPGARPRAAPPAGAGADAADAGPEGRRSREQALADPGVQALLEVFPGRRSGDVEEMWTGPDASDHHEHPADDEAGAADAGAPAEADGRAARRGHRRRRHGHRRRQRRRSSCSR